MPYEHFPELTREQLVEAAYDMTGGDLKSLSLDQVAKLMTVASHVFDLCLNEIEHRGELQMKGGMVIVPYCSDHMVLTALTRDGQPGGA